MGMGKYASKGGQKYLLRAFAFFVYLINAIGLSIPGGGFFGDLRQNNPEHSLKLLTLEILIQVFYAWWNADCIRSRTIDHEIVANHLDEFIYEDDSSTDFSVQMASCGVSKMQNSINDDLTLEERDII